MKAELRAQLLQEAAEEFDRLVEGSIVEVEDIGRAHGRSADEIAEEVARWRARLETNKAEMLARLQRSFEEPGAPEGLQ